MITLAVPPAEVTLLATEQQSELGAVLRDLLSERSPETVVRRHMESEEGFDRDTWRELSSELGVGGLAVPESLGGSGGSFADVAVVTEELGRSLSCVPWLSSVVLAQSLLLGLSDDSAAAEVLARLADGNGRACVAFAEPGGAWSASGVELVAEHTASGWSLSGIKGYVVDGHTADLVLVVARTRAGLSAFAIEADAPGLSRVALPTMDLTRKQARLTLANVPARLLGEDGQAAPAFDRMLDLAAIMLAQECVGGAQLVLDSAVDYAKTRF